MSVDFEILAVKSHTFSHLIMSFLFKINKYILVPVLSEWLTLTDHVQLDTSLGNHELNLQLLRLCWEFPQVFQAQYFKDSHMYLTPQSNTWLSKRYWNSISAEINLSFLKQLKSSFLSSLMSRMLDTNESKTSLRSSLRKVISLKLSANLLEQHASSIAEVLSHCSKLNELVIESEKSFRNFSLPVQSGLPCKILRFNMIYDIRFFLPLVRSCSNLLELHMDSFCHQDFKLSAAVVVWCRRLRCFNVAMRERRDQFILALHAGQRFNTFHVTKGSELLLKTLLIFRGGEALTNLSIEWFPSKSHLSLPLDISSVCSNVTQLTLSHWKTIDLPFVLAIQEHMRLLNRVSLIKCYNIDKNAIPVLLSDKFPLSVLKTGELFPCEEILQINSVCCLETLDLSFSKSLTDECLFVLGKYCPLISDLNVSFCPNISDEGVRAIIRNRKLTKLKMSNKALTDATLENLFTFCYDLHTLNIAYLRRFLSLDVILRLIVKCKALQFLTCSIEGDDLKRVNESVKMFNPKLKILKCVENNGIVFDTM